MSMIHSVPELKVSVEQAKKLGKADEEKLLERRKLVLLVDLDQTLIHTTNEKQNFERDDVVKFQLYGPNSPTYQTKLRPFTTEFLTEISKMYELHICTFGARMYAHKIAQILDPEGKLFSHRILSRDECFDPQLKTGNLSALFPCGDSMVCIIDDREDVWNYSTNLIAVRPYSFFANTGDINSPNRARDAMIAKASKALNSKTDADISSTASTDNSSDVHNSSKCSEIDPDSSSSAQPDSTDASSDEMRSNKLDGQAETAPDSNDVEAAADKESSEEQDILKQKAETKPGEADKKGELTDVKSKASDTDDYLLYLQDILKRIHSRFYKEYDDILKYTAEGESVSVPDLKKIIPNLRKEILKSVNIVFTGVIPTNIVPEKSKMWLLAKALGANVSREIIFEGSPLEKTTHLIAAKIGTAKVQKALRCKQIRIVNPLWLYTCADRWERVEERLFPLNKDDDYGNAQKRKLKLTPDQEMFMNADLIRFACSTRSRKPPSLSFKQEKIQPGPDFPTYDPITGKQVRKQCVDVEENRPSTSGLSSSGSARKAIETTEDVLPHNMLEFSPLAAFSRTDLLQMDREVEDACSEGDHLSSSSSDDSDMNEDGCEALSTACRSSNSMSDKRKRKIERDSSSEDSLTNEFPKGWSNDKINPRKHKRIASNQCEENEDDEDDEDEEEVEEDSMDAENREGEDDFNDSVGSYDEEMGRALERDFLN